jgi:excinuclease ABC subunit C
VLRRRFTRLLAEDAPWPDLVMIDGGKGQLRRAEAVLAEVGIDPVELDLVALAKGRTEEGQRVARRDRQEKIFVARTGQAVLLPAGSRAIRILDQLRDEAHRFAITYHRKLRTRARVGSALDEVPGVGPRFRQRILTAFGSVEALQGKSADEVAEQAHVPLRVARRVQERFGGESLEA